ncbi:MAG: DUF4136 domain-containing protein [Acidobacteriota bacterium]
MWCSDLSARSHPRLSLRTRAVPSLREAMAADPRGAAFISPVAIGALLVAAVLGFATPAAAVDDSMKYDRKADFSTYETYDWIEQKKRPEGSPLAVGGEIDTKIRNAIDRQLADQGYRPAIDEEPDFLVSFDGAMVQVTDIEANRRQIASGVAWVVEGDINSYRNDTLIISIHDSKTEKAVWSAWTRNKIKDPRNPDRRIKKSVRKLLRKFPPAN